MRQSQVPAVSVGVLVLEKQSGVLLYCVYFLVGRGGLAAEGGRTLGNVTLT